MRRLEALPYEIHLEIIQRIPSVPLRWQDADVYALQQLSNCSRGWRILCLPWLFRSLDIGAKSNGAITRFIAYNATRYGHFVEYVRICTFPTEDLAGGEAKMVASDLSQDSLCRWSHTRDHLLHALMDFLPNVTTLAISLRRDYIWQMDAPEHNSRVNAIHLTTAAISKLRKLKSVFMCGPFSDSMAALLLNNVPMSIERVELTVDEWEDLVDYSTSSAAAEAIDNRPQLDRLYLNRVPDIAALCRKREASSSLRVLELDHVKLHINTLAELVCKYQNTLHHLSVTECNIDRSPLATDPSFRTALTLPKLTQLTIVNLTSAMDTELLLHTFRHSQTQRIALFVQVPRLQESFQLARMLQDGDFPNLKTIELSFRGGKASWIASFVNEITQVCAGRGIQPLIHQGVSPSERPARPHE